MYHTIVVPVAHTDGICAVKHASLLARYLGGRVVLVSVVANEGQANAACMRLNELGQLGRRRPETVVRVVPGGGTATAYAAIVRELQAELVILGVHSGLVTELPGLTRVPMLLVPTDTAASGGARWLAAGQRPATEPIDLGSKRPASRGCVSAAIAEASAMPPTSALFL